MKDHKRRWPPLSHVAVRDIRREKILPARLPKNQIADLPIEPGAGRQQNAALLQPAKRLNRAWNWHELFRIAGLQLRTKPSIRALNLLLHIPLWFNLLNEVPNNLPLRSPLPLLQLIFGKWDPILHQ